ncbi:MAG: 6-phospho-beta-glucosidase [Arachnia sp.]
MSAHPLLKLVILGGGGFRVPLVYEAVARGAAAGGARIGEVVLHDASAERLAVMSRVLGDLAAEIPGAPRVTCHTDMRTALRGADFVFAAVRVGGTAGRIADERVALRLGLLGQETIGPGGLAYALRTIPVMREAARVIAEVAPDAWTINFTNPAGIVTQAMREFLGDSVVGICDTPIGLVRRAARLLGVAAEDVDYDYVGLNHLGWLRALRVDGRDLLPGLLASDELLAGIEEARIVGPDLVRALGALPNEYLFYYWLTDEAIAHIAAAGETRGEYLARQQAAFYDGAGEVGSALASWRAALHEREATYMAEAREEGEQREEADVEGGGYQEVAVRLMTALATGTRERMILNVGNTDRIVEGLPEDAVVEVGCVVDGDGVHAVPVAQPELWQLGMMARLRGSEQLIARAAATGDPEAAWLGFALHPLVDSPSLGRALLDGYRAAHPEIDRLLR